ncbi:rhamnogalacturonan lyase family protein [Kineococcus sp. G2]|uniref:rhamnogalacturonan lyase family protein n=1 Tax=Kineococcus sp. G2 TaxID=3127484 RepID=UPI00301DB27D
MPVLPQHSPRPSSRTRRAAGAGGTALLSLVIAAGTGLPAGAAPLPDRLFDLQCAGSPTADDHTAVAPTTAYSSEQGYGFLTPLAANACRDRGGDGDLAGRDFVLPAAGTTFRVDVPDGTYTVVVRSGDLIASSSTGVAVGGQTLPARNPGSGVVGERVLEGVRASGGHLDLTFSGSSPRLNSIEVLRPVGTPRDVTASVGATAGSASVGLAWPAVDGASGYRVHRSADGGQATAVADVDAPSWTDGDVQLADTYTYEVAALGATGREGARSEALTVTVVDAGAPAPATPQDLTAAWDGDGVDLAWSAVEGAAAYDVYRSRAGREPVRVTRTTGTTWTDTSAQPTADHEYAVAAVAPGGRSERSGSVAVPATVHLQRQAERIDRSPVAVSTGEGTYVGWRLLGDDPQDLAFNVYRDGELVNDRPVTGSTNLLDAGGAEGSTYRVSTVVDGIERWATDEFRPWQQQHLDVPLDRPAGGTTPDGVAYTYSANDASVADLDGDGQYEVVVKWYPSNAQDNSRPGYTGNTYLDAYELDGTRLWRIDLGVNIRSGAHYTQFQVYDYDGDGRAELVVKTADGTTDAAGTVIGDPDADHRTANGYVLSGPEFLTVFDGARGVALDTADYVPARGDVGSWGDTYGNRVDRFLAGTAYLDGEHPSAVFSRGYYTRAVVAAWDWDGSDLTQRWVFDSDEAGEQYAGQGNHQFSVADVDGDQKDEIVFGSVTLDDDGTALHNTGLGHGDALHVSDFDPSRPGQEVFAAHEDIDRSGGRGATFRDAATGEVLWSIPAERDTGRAAMGDVDPRHAGAEGWAVGGDAAWNSPVGQMRSASGELISTGIPAANFLTWWDGDLLREVTDHDYDPDTGAGVPTISEWNWQEGRAEEVYRATGTLSGNGTKGNPALQADLFGDWREEVVTRLADSSALRIATTVDPTDVRLRTLMSDPAYRLAVAWQNTGYNQPPHTSYFLGEGMSTPAAPDLRYTSAAPVGERVPGPATAAPEVAKLSDDANPDHDGDYTIGVDVRKGQNAETVVLLENGTEVARRDVPERTPQAQHVEFHVTGKAPGTYTYTAVLTNRFGSTTSKQVKVKVKAG